MVNTVMDPPSTLSGMPSIMVTMPQSPIMSQSIMPQFTMSQSTMPQFMSQSTMPQLCLLLPTQHLMHLPLLPSTSPPQLPPISPHLLSTSLHLLTSLHPLTMSLPTKRNPNPMPSNTVLLMTTQAPNSVPKKPLTAKLSQDHTKLPFPTVVSKPLPTLLTIITVMLLMSNTKEPPSTLRPNLTTQLPLPLTSPLMLPK